jgi:hypothetical protein
MDSIVIMVLDAALIVSIVRSFVRDWRKSVAARAKRRQTAPQLRDANWHVIWEREKEEYDIPFQHAQLGELGKIEIGDTHLLGAGPPDWWEKQRQQLLDELTPEPEPVPPTLAPSPFSSVSSDFGPSVGAEPPPPTVNNHPLASMVLLNEDIAWLARYDYAARRVCGNVVDFVARHPYFLPESYEHYMREVVKASDAHYRDRADRRIGRRLLDHLSSEDADGGV